MKIIDNKKLIDFFRKEFKVITNRFYGGCEIFEKRFFGKYVGGITRIEEYILIHNLKYLEQFKKIIKKYEEETKEELTLVIDKNAK